MWKKAARCKALTAEGCPVVHPGLQDWLRHNHQDPGTEPARLRGDSCHANMLHAVLEITTSINKPPLHTFYLLNSCTLTLEQLEVGRNSACVTQAQQ